MSVESSEPYQDAAVGELRKRTVRGAVASTLSQTAGIILRTGSVIVLSRLLLPRDFGLVAMATAVTGFIAMFRDLGLSTASVQRATVTEAQISTLFWANVLVGTLLAVVCVLAAPLMVQFYGEPRLFAISFALAAGFLVNGAGVQHRALLQRQMKFGSLAVIDTSAMALSIVTAAAMALANFGYWAVVVMNVMPQMIGSAGAWIVARWIPGRPRRHSGVGSLLRFGGTLTLNSFVVQIAYNTDKILLGRFWGAEALGLYSRAYQLVNIPVDGFGSAVSQVALPALAKVQEDPDRLRRNFLRGFGLFLTLMVPITVASAIFSHDIVRVFLGAKWMEAVPVFTRLTPIMLVLAIVNPLSWLMLSTGRTMRSLLIALVIAPVVIASYWAGLPWGPIGVATGFSIAMLLLAIPIVIWACRGTSVSPADVAREARPVFVSAAVAAAVAYAGTHYTQALTPPLLRLTVDSTILFAVYAAGLFLTLEDKSVYWKVLADTNLVRARTKPTS